MKYPSPTNVTETRRFLGMVNYMGRFIPNVAEKTRNIRELLKKERAFTWTEDHKCEFEKLKQIIATTPVLGKYDSRKRTRVSTDASSYGVGAVLEQEVEKDTWKKPVYFCSKTLNDTQRCYAQIEKEAYAITWACERLEQFLLGSKFEILTDHKPLTVILATKELNKLTNRLERFRMRLSKFNYDIKYVPGRNLDVPDALSRAPIKDAAEKSEEPTVDIYVNAIIEESHDMMMGEDQIRIQQGRDSDICQLKMYVTEGWPRKDQVTGMIRSYYKYRDNLKIDKCILVYDDRIVVPKQVRKWVLQAIHEGHQGIGKCVARAREAVWWPGLKLTVHWNRIVVRLRKSDDLIGPDAGSQSANHRLDRSWTTTVPLDGQPKSICNIPGYY